MLDFTRWHDGAGNPVAVIQIRHTVTTGHLVASVLLAAQNNGLDAWTEARESAELLKRVTAREAETALRDAFLDSGETAVEYRAYDNASPPQIDIARDVARRHWPQAF